MEPPTEYEVIIKRETDNDEDNFPTLIKREFEDEDETVNIHQSRQKVFKNGKPLKSKRPSSERWYKCQICARVYETVAGCHSHIVVKHGT